MSELIVPTMCLYEVFKRVLQQRREGDALQAVATMMQGEVVALDAALALEAAKLSAERQLPMADSVILATGRAYGATVYTQDGDFEGLEGVAYVQKKRQD